MLDKNDHKGDFAWGGNYDIEQKYVEPTIILNPDENSKVMKEEVFIILFN